VDRSTAPHYAAITRPLMGVSLEGGNTMIGEESSTGKEIARTAHKAIEATEKLGRFIAKALGEPIDQASAMLADRIRYMRWEQQVKLIDRCQEIIKKRKIEGKQVIASPKALFPLLEAASLENDPGLRELYSQLLASFVDPSKVEIIRTGFVEIVKQLEPIDAKVLQVIYINFVKQQEDTGSRTSTRRSPNSYQMRKRNIVSTIPLADSVYEAAVDNLIRLRCIETYKAHDTIDIDLKNDWVNTEVTFDHGYSSVALTSFGQQFCEACALDAL